MKRRVAQSTNITMADVAKAADVHKSTVSLALRDQASIPLATRLKLQRLARKLGYRPDPNLSVFNTLRRSTNRQKTHQTLAFVSDFSSVAEMNSHERHHQLYAAAKAACAARGHSLDFFLLGKGRGQLNAQRLQQILKARGIKGVLLASLRSVPDELAPLLRDNFCVSLGTSIPGWNIDSLEEDFYGGMRLLCRTLSARGIRRLGVLAADDLSQHNLQLLRAGYLSEALDERCTKPVPFLLSNASRPAQPALNTWLREQRVDALVCCGASPQSLPPTGSRLPCFTFDTHRDHHGLPGIAAAFSPLCEKAIELITMRLFFGGNPSAVAPASQLLPAVLRGL